MEPASVIRGDSYTMEVPDETAIIIEAPRFLEHNDRERKPEGDNMFTSWRCKTLMSCESTDVLTGNTHQVTSPGCGGVSGSVTGTHKDTRGPDSHSRYRFDRSPEPAFEGHTIDYEKFEYNEDKGRKDKRCEYNKGTHLLEDKCKHNMLVYNVHI